MATYDNKSSVEPCVSRLVPIRLYVGKQPENSYIYSVGKNGVVEIARRLRGNREVFIVSLDDGSVVEEFSPESCVYECSIKHQIIKNWGVFPRESMSAHCEKCSFREGCQADIQIALSESDSPDSRRRVET